MPEFSPGELKTAIAPMSNPTVKAFDYRAELYMGTNLALMSQVGFHLEAEEGKDISLPVIMPTVAGTYPVYIGVFSGGESIALYKATEDVIIAPAGVAEFAYVSDIRQTTYYTSAHGRDNELAVTVEIDIQNQGNAPGVCTVRVERSLRMSIDGEHEWDWMDHGWKEGLLSATLQPGEVLTFWDNCRRHVGGRVLWEKLRFNGSPGISDWVYEI